MKRAALIIALAAALPVSAFAQQNVEQRLQEVLPQQVRERVMSQIRTAWDDGLPGSALSNLALEGVAKGRSGQEVLEAVQLLARDMTRARDALRIQERVMAPGDIEAATAAMRMGADAESIRELARTQARIHQQEGEGPGEPVADPLRERTRTETRTQVQDPARTGEQVRTQTRTMAVPLLVLGGLVDRGLPSDEALAAVRMRLAAGDGDGELLRNFPGVARGLTRGMAPEEAGRAMERGFAGFNVPVAGVAVPVGRGPGEDGAGPGRNPGRRGGGGN
jgi:hypothetical protein